MKNFETIKAGAPAGVSDHTPGAPVRHFLTRILVARAAELARIGRYQEAESLLGEEIQEHGENAAILDLYARIRAQQGRLSEAEALWRQVLRFDPMNEAGLEGLRCIARAQRPVLINYWQRFLAGAGGLALLSFGIWAVWYALTDVRGRMDSEEMQADIRQKQTMERLAEFGKSHAALAKDMELVLARTDQLSHPLQNHSTQQTQPAARKVAFAVPAGVFVQEKNGNTRFMFNSGLFEKGAVLRLEARSQLSALGRELTKHKDGMAALHVTGYTDNLAVRAGRKFSDNTSLGFSRAMVVVNHLRKDPKLASVPFTISANGPDPAPFPNEGLHNNQRNRTATITVSWPASASGSNSP